jgi:hypothetical protein
MKILALLASTFVLALSACSHVQVTRSNAAADAPYDVAHGFTVYAPKPFLLVARAGDGGKIISVTTLMLPDTNDPHYVRQKGVIGKLNYNFAVENGILKSFGSDADSKTAEILKEVVGAATGYAGVVKTLEEAGKIGAESDKLRKESASQAELNAAIKGIEDVQKALDAIAAQPPAGTTPAQISVIVLASGRLSTLSQRLKAPDAVSIPAVQTAVIDQLKTVIKTLEELKNGASKEFINVLDRPIVELQTAVGIVAGTPPSKPLFELYQIHMDGTSTTLTPVKLP